ncbi:MAG TPA: SLC13 family permease [Chloroflexota bacterium]|nr:SLC13 family permease [Chloroflexota bacterium]HUM69152.1 SLC13 family permease [Chloroflexota bacterium]
MFGFTIAQLTLLLILGGAFILFLTERIRIDLTAVFIIICLTITGILSPEEALSGFGSEPAIVAASIFVLSGAMYTTGLSDRLGLWIGRLAGRRFQRMIAVIMTAVAALSAFTHHLTITAVMLPITLKLSREHKIPASHLLMPMSFAASLGTTITILGAPAFLIADRILKQAGEPGIGIFSIAPIGIAITIAGTAFILIAGRYLLPARTGNQNSAEDRFQLSGYYTELVITEKSPFIDRTVVELEEKVNNRFQLTGWLRNGRAQSRPYQYQRLQAGDVLLVRTTPDELVTIQQEPGIDLYPVIKYKNGESSTAAKNGSQQLVQAVVAPGSEFVGRTIGQIDFRQSYEVIVAGIWRRSAWLRAELSRVRLHEGDVLLLLGDEPAIARLEQVKSFLMLVPFRGESFMRHKASVAAVILVSSILLAALGVVPVVIALLVGAATAVLTNCLTPQQAYRAIDTRIYVFIAGVVPLGLAMQNTGTADLVADRLYNFVAQWPPTLILLLLFVAAAIMTQMMSDAGTVVLLGPVAVALALALGKRPEPYVVVVAVAAVASFLTPIGHHGNLLVYGPGGYQFSDFLKVGTPLTIIVALLTIFLANLLWPG